MSAVRHVLSGRAHLDALRAPLAALEAELERLERWGGELARVLAGGGRLLTVGNGGSAAQAQHLATELVGRYRDDERPPLSALALCTDPASLTAISNDFGAEAAFARQVHAHGRPGDVLLALSTSGESPNVVAAVDAAAEAGLRTWALTGPAPNALCALADDALCVEARYTPTVQEIHQVAIHLLCAEVDVRLGTPAPALAEDRA